MSQEFNREVDYIARLARLTLDSDEAKAIARQLDAILDTARKIQDLDTAEVEPTTHVLALPTVMREDEVKGSLPVNKVLANAPNHQDGYFMVPSIIGSEKSEE